MPFHPSVTIVIPAYNEAENLPAILDEALRFASEQCRDGSILVINDGSTDDTAQVLSRYGEVPRLRVVTHERNRGLTAALRTGFYGADTEYVTWIPADGQIPLPELGKILDANTGEDLVLSTYRHRPDGAIRMVMSRTVRVMMRAATGLVDRIEGPYLFRRRLLDELHLVSRTSAGSIGLELAVKARAAGKRIASTEIECAPRRAGRSKVANLRNILAYLGEVWRIRRSL
jgi:glycosyltransferase involved in cell wall biosynthesis